MLAGCVPCASCSMPKPCCPCPASLPRVVSPGVTRARRRGAGWGGTCWESKAAWPPVWLRATTALCQVCPVSCSTLTAHLANIANTPPGAFLLLLFFFPQQDELEFGYVEAPHKTFPVVFDSPRNRGLKDFAFKKILVRHCIANPLSFPQNSPPGGGPHHRSPLPQGPDFGYVTREPPGKNITSLDSFGNLDVSPPVTVRGKEYPLGRILIGSSLPW